MIDQRSLKMSLFIHCVHLYIVYIYINILDIYIKNDFTEVSPNFHSPMSHEQVKAHTNEEESFGTSATLYLTIRGDKGTSDLLTLLNGSRKASAGGQSRRI